MKFFLDYFTLPQSDGPGAFDFIQGHNASTPRNPFWQIVKGKFIQVIPQLVLKYCGFQVLLLLPPQKSRLIAISRSLSC